MDIIVLQRYLSWQIGLHDRIELSVYELIQTFLKDAEVEGYCTWRINNLLTPRLKYV